MGHALLKTGRIDFSPFFAPALKGESRKINPFPYKGKSG